MIKYLVMDVDGTLTDGKIYMGNDGESVKAFSIKDGCGIHDLLGAYGIEPVIITGRKSKILENRCKEIGITKIFQGISNKIEKLLTITNNLDEVAYIGDDINDLSCMKPIKEAGGIIGCPLDAVKEVKAISDFISTQIGGNGAVREFIEWLIAAEKNNEMLGVRIAEAVEYIKNLDKTNLQAGKYQVNDDFYYSVQSYQTKPIEKCKLESHRKYVDIQWMISGVEAIETKDIACLKLDIEYNEDKDIMYWVPQKNMMRTVLTPGSYVILYPRDAHRGSILLEKNIDVVKIVGKVRVD